MRCPNCGVSLAEGALACPNCGTPLSATRPPLSATWSNDPYGDAGDPDAASSWSEYSGMHPAIGRRSDPTYPAPGSYGAPVRYPKSEYLPTVPGSYRPLSGGGQSTPRRWRPWLLVAIILVGLVLLICSVALLGVGAYQVYSRLNPTTKQAVAARPIVTTPDANQLYKQITSRTPVATDTLQNASISPWQQINQPNFGCRIAADGLHVYVKDQAKLYYCNSGHGTFNNFAFQVEMQMVSGDGGGLTFRDDATAGNHYLFFIAPDGTYAIRTQRNHQSLALLRQGNSTPFSPGQKLTLTVIAQGSQLSFYVNQQLLTSLQDSTYSNGDLGVMAVDLSTPTEVIYTNAQVWSL